MRLATLRLPAGATSAARIEDERVVLLDGIADVGALLRLDDWRTRAGAAGSALRTRDVPPSAWAPVVPRPGKIVCVGLNYASHILEMGRELPEHPTLFAKYPEALVGAYDDVVLPPDASSAVDWEGELAIVLGARVRRASSATAADAIAGYAVLDDVTMRDWQYRTPQWLQGKTFEATTPFGPWMTTSDAWQPGGELTTTVDGEVVQRASTGDLVFDPVRLVAYVSTILTLEPGDVIATGTPGGVGHARTPRRRLEPGSVLETAIVGLGAQRNRIVT